MDKKKLAYVFAHVSLVIGILTHEVLEAVVVACFFVLTAIFYQGEQR